MSLKDKKEYKNKRLLTILSKKREYIGFRDFWCDKHTFLVIMNTGIWMCVSKSVAVCLLSERPMLTVAALAVPAGGLLVAEVLGVDDPATATATAADAAADTAAAEEDADEEGGGACCRRRALCPSLTIWMMASASASSWRTAAWILLAEPRLVEPAQRRRDTRDIKNLQKDLIPRRTSTHNMSCQQASMRTATKSFKVKSGNVLRRPVLKSVFHLLSLPPVCLAFLLARRVSSLSWMMTCSTRRKNFCVEVLDVSELMQGSCSSRPPSVRFWAATITTLSEPSNLWPQHDPMKKTVIVIITFVNNTGPAVALNTYFNIAKKIHVIFFFKKMRSI